MPTLIDLDPTITVGELVVGLGTLALAGVTWKLAKSSEKSLESLDLPFLLAAPDSGEAFNFSPVFEEGPEPVDAEWIFSVDLTNLGAGPAIFDGISLIDEETEVDLVKKDWKVDFLIRPDDAAQAVGIPLKDDPPEPNARLALETFYRSASGNRYVTVHQVRVGKRMRAHRLKFRREEAKG